MSIYFYKHWGQLPSRPGRGTLTQKRFLSLYLHRGNKDDSKINGQEAKTGHRLCPADASKGLTCAYTRAQDDGVPVLAAFPRLKRINLCSAIAAGAALEPGCRSNGWFKSTKETSVRHRKSPSVTFWLGNQAAALCKYVCAYCIFDVWFCSSPLSDLPLCPVAPSSPSVLEFYLKTAHI